MNLLLMYVDIVSITKYGRQRMMKYFNADKKLVPGMTCCYSNGKIGAIISFTLAIADDGTILFEEESGSGNKVDK